MAQYIAKIGVFDNYVGRHDYHRRFYLTNEGSYDGVAHSLQVGTGNTIYWFGADSATTTLTMAPGDYPTSMTLTGVTTLNNVLYGGFNHGYPEGGAVLSANLYLADIDATVKCHLGTIQIQYPYPGAWEPINMTFDLTDKTDARNLSGKQLCLYMEGDRGLELHNQIRVTINTTKQGATIDNSNSGGKLSFSATQNVETVNVEPGTLVTMYQNPDSGKSLDAITTVPADFVNQITKNKDGSMQFNMPSTPVTIIPTWKDGLYKITATYTPSNVGSIVVDDASESRTPITSAVAGSNVHVTITTNAGYTLNKDKLKITEGITIVEDAEMDSEGDSTYIDPGNQGTIEDPGNDPYGDTEGDEAEPNGDTETYYGFSFVMPAKDVTINALADMDIYEINVSCDPQEGGKTEIIGGNVFAVAGDIVRVTQTPNAGYEFKNWKMVRHGGTESEVIESDENRIRYYVYESKIEELKRELATKVVGSAAYVAIEEQIEEYESYKHDLGYLFEMPPYDVDLTVTYKKTDYHVTTQPKYENCGRTTVTIGGTSIPDSDENGKVVYTANVNDELVLEETTQIPNEYTFVNWTVSYGLFQYNVEPMDHRATITMPASDMTITANYRKHDILWSIKDMQITHEKQVFSVTNTSSVVDTFGKDVKFVLYKDGVRIGPFTDDNNQTISFEIGKEDSEKDITLKIAAIAINIGENDEETEGLESEGPVRVLYVPFANHEISYFDGTKYQDVQLCIYSGKEWVEF